jgi:hypothetical protein
MGFTPQQARIALASTDTGLDVEQALETLLNNTEQTPDVVEARDLDRSPPRQSPRPPPRPRRTTDSPRQTPLESQEAGYQEQADKLIAQATQLGKGMFNRANAFWKESRERVQKAYDEHQGQQAGASSTDARRDGRPKWMEGDQEGFKDEEVASTARRERERQPKERPERAERLGRLVSFIWNRVTNLVIQRSSGNEAAYPQRWGTTLHEASSGAVSITSSERKTVAVTCSGSEVYSSSGSITAETASIRLNYSFIRTTLRGGFAQDERQRRFQTWQLR